MAEILCSTGAVIGRPNGRNYRLLEDLSKQLRFDGFELMMYEDWYADLPGLIGFINMHKLYIPVFHCDKLIGEAASKGELEEAYEQFGLNCNVACEIGAKKLVLHLWGGYASDSNIENNLKAYEKLRKIADNHGLELLIENVVCNHEDPMKHWCELKERYPDVKLIFDTKMSEFHGQTNLLYEKEYDWLWKDGHIRHYHVNDYAGKIMEWDKLNTLPMGAGHVDFDKFFKYINQIGYDGSFTIESTAFDRINGIVDVEMLNKQYERVKAHLH